MPTVERTSQIMTVICFLHFVRLRPVRMASPGSLRPVLPITVRCLATMLPRPSVPRARIFAPRQGQAVSEFPSSSRRCGIAPRSCLLYAGWFAGTVRAGIQRPDGDHHADFGSGVSAKFSPVYSHDASDTGFSRQHRVQSSTRGSLSGSERWVFVSGLPPRRRATPSRRPLNLHVTAQTWLL